MSSPTAQITVYAVGSITARVGSLLRKQLRTSPLLIGGIADSTLVIWHDTEPHHHGPSGPNTAWRVTTLEVTVPAGETWIKAHARLRQAVHTALDDIDSSLYGVED